MTAVRLLAVIGAVLAAGGIAMASSPPSPVPGRVLWVIDGDTYQISHPDAPQGEPVRARHFDTPEKGSRAQCDAERIKAQQATQAARRLLPRGSTVLLSDFGRDRYGRLLATVTLSDGNDLASWFIGAGLAHPYEGGRKRGWCTPSGVS
jgi:micrococcal nuclease